MSHCRPPGIPLVDETDAALAAGALRTGGTGADEVLAPAANGAGLVEEAVTPGSDMENEP